MYRWQRPGFRCWAAELQEVSQETGQAGTMVRVLSKMNLAKGTIRRSFQREVGIGSEIASPLTLSLAPVGERELKEETLEPLANIFVRVILREQSDRIIS